MNEAHQILDDDRATMSIIVSNKDGEVIGQSSAARVLLEPTDGSTQERHCWKMMQAAGGAENLPCTEDCVKTRLKRRNPVEADSINLRGRAFELRCEPVGEQIVTTLRPEPDCAPRQNHMLTPREIEVLQLLANGLDGTGIADVLGISPGTVRTHVENMRASLDCRTRAGLVAKGYHLRYLS